MTLARFHHRVLSPLRVYEVWKSIWPGLEVPRQLALLSSPPIPSRLLVLSWGLCSARTFDPALLPTACRSRDSAAGSWAAPAYWPQRLCWLSRPLQWKYCWFFFLFSARRRWKRFSSGNKTPSILVNVKGPLCLHWYFTSEPFFHKLSLQLMRRADTDKRRSTCLRLSAGVREISRAQSSRVRSNLLLKTASLFKVRLIGSQG